MIEQDIIIHPQKGRREPGIGPAGLLLVTPGEAGLGHYLLTDRGGRDSFLYNSRLTLSKDCHTFVAGPAVGAPMAAMTLEKLIVLGARRVIMFGWVGAVDNRLKVGDILIGGKALSGEGTSGYYPTGERALGPSSSLVQDLDKYLRSFGHKPREATIWSTDAPYRENRKHLARLHEDADLFAVDMEYAALCAVAQFRSIDFAALFLVSDELYHDNWRPGFTEPHFRTRSKDLVTLLADPDNHWSR